MKKPTISSELKEAALGVFIMQTLNMGWLMLLGNLTSI
jgi:lipid-binding SYLF domain-containing protein